METSLMHTLGLWSLQKYKFGDVQNVDFFFIFHIFSRVLKVFIKSFYVWSYSAKNKWFNTGQDWIWFAMETNLMHN